MKSMVMKILHVLPSMDPRHGGVCQAVRTLASGLEREGVSNEIVCMAEPGDAFLRELYPVHALGKGKTAWGYNPGLSLWLVENLGRFSTVIVHGMWQYPGYAVREALNLIKKKTSQVLCPRFFLMPHGMLDPYFQHAKGRKLKAIRNVIYWRLIESHNVNQADGLLFTCGEEMRLARIPFRPYKPDSESVAGLGVDEPPSYNHQHKRALEERCPGLSGEPYLLFLSRIHEKKGVDLLIRAYADLVKRSYSAKVGAVLSGTDGEIFDAKGEKPLPKLVIAGPGLDTEYGKIQRDFVGSNPLLRDRVIFPGMLSGDAKWGAFYGCQAFILPSHQENFGIAIVEALGCGKPVLITKKVNIWREIEENGASISGNDDFIGVKRMLEEWMNFSASQKDSMEEAALSCFKENYSAKAAALKILETITPENRTYPVY